VKRRIRMNGVGCTLYEENVWSKRWTQGKKNKCAITTPLVESTLLEREKKMKKSSWVGDSYFILVLSCFWKKCNHWRNPSEMMPKFHSNGFIAY
jgi:hypothetical protein